MYNYSPHFRDQETEAQRGSISCPTSQSYKMVKVASESSLSDSRSCILHHPALLLKSLFSLLSVVSALLLVTVFTGPCDVYKDYSLYSREIKDFLKQNQDSFSVTWNHYLSQISVKKRNQRAVALKCSQPALLFGAEAQLSWPLWGCFWFWESKAPGVDSGEKYQTRGCLGPKSWSRQGWGNCTQACAHRSACGTIPPWVPLWWRYGRLQGFDDCSLCVCLSFACFWHHRLHFPL